MFKRIKSQLSKLNVINKVKKKIKRVQVYMQWSNRTKEFHMLEM